MLSLQPMLQKQCVRNNIKFELLYISKIQFTAYPILFWLALPVKECKQVFQFKEFE